MTDKHSQPEKNDIIRFDYEQSLQTYRMLADIRFKLLAFVPIISGVAIAILTTDPVQASSQLVLAGGVFGLLITLGITIYDQRNTQFMNASRFRARELESSLSLPLEGQFPQIPPKDLKFFGWMKVWSDRGLALIYGTVLAAWVFVITRTTFDLIGLSADLLVTLLTILTFAALQLEFHRMDRRAKSSAENVISKSKSLSGEVNEPLFTEARRIGILRRSAKGRSTPVSPIRLAEQRLSGLRADARPSNYRLRA